MIKELEIIRNKLVEAGNETELMEIKEKINEVENRLREIIIFYSDDGK